MDPGSPRTHETRFSNHSSRHAAARERRAWGSRCAASTLAAWEPRCPSGVHWAAALAFASASAPDPRSRNFDHLEHPLDDLFGRDFLGIRLVREHEAVT